MEKLLQWATAQQSEDPEVRARAPTPDPKVLAQVLGADTGKDDATLMKEDISVVVCNDPAISIDDKLAALEDFEILVQNLDNANNILPMGIWPEISKLYQYEGEEKDEVRGLAALITGTAVQNNPKCQDDYLNHVGKDGMMKLLKLASPNENFNVRARALYAVSALVAHHGGLYLLFVECEGWKALKEFLSVHFENERKQTKVLLRLLSLVKSLMYDEITTQEAIKEGGAGINIERTEKAVVASKNDRFKAMKEQNLVSVVSEKLSNTSNIEVNARVINLLQYMIEQKYDFSNEEKDLIKSAVGKINKNDYPKEEVESILTLS